MKIMNPQQCGYDLTLEALKMGSIFGALSDGAIQFLLSHSQLQEYQKGEPIYSQGDVADYFFAVLHGAVDVSKRPKKRDSDYREYSIEEVQIQFGESLGFGEMIALTPRVADAWAGEKSLLMKIDWDLLNSIHEEHPFDFGILILNLSRNIARIIIALAEGLAAQGITVITTSKRYDT